MRRIPSSIKDLDKKSKLVYNQSLDVDANPQSHADGSADGSADASVASSMDLGRIPSPTV